MVEDISLLNSRGDIRCAGVLAIRRGVGNVQGELEAGPLREQRRKTGLDSQNPLRSVLLHTVRGPIGAGVRHQLVAESIRVVGVEAHHIEAQALTAKSNASLDIRALLTPAPLGCTGSRRSKPLVHPCQ
jgi:hypothetical protein